MKTAQFRYTQTNLDISIHIYFDLKAFDFIKPPLNADQEDQLIRQISDSIAAAMPKDTTEKHFYIKRAVRYTSSSQLKLFCTDGFLMDIALAIPITEQAFAKERINIVEVEQLPTRFKFSNETLKVMNDRLPLFEEEIRKDTLSGKISVVKEETIRPEKQTITLREYASEKALDVLSAIGNIKKEIRGIAESNDRSLKMLLKQVNETDQRTHDDIMKETNTGLTEEENKKKLETFAKYTISQFGGSDVEKNKIDLTNKIQEISMIPNKFDGEVETITQAITKQAQNLLAFKQNLITALYDSAKQYYQDELSKQMQSATPNAKKLMMIEFNKKFSSIAVLNESGNLSSLAEAQENLVSLSLEQLQQLVSNEDKENPGVLQKCNTSWIEESPELQILMKNLGRLNGAFSNLFKEDPQYEHFAHVDMVQITRIPFPRSFQFSFSPHALEYKTAVDDFCKTQKETISNMAKEYKKTMQISDISDKTERALDEITKQTNLMKKPLTEYRELLRRTEMSKQITATVMKDYAQTEKAFATAQQQQTLIATKLQPQFKLIKKKTMRMILDIQTNATNATNIMKQITDSQAEADTIVNNVSTTQNEIKPHLDEMDEKIRSMSEKRHALIEANKIILSQSDKLAFYEKAIHLNERMVKSMTQSDMQKERIEAKGIIVNLIKSHSRDIAATEGIKKHMVDLYSQIDIDISTIEKQHQDLTALKDQLFNDLNDKKDLSSEELKDKLQLLSEKLDLIDSEKNSVVDHLKELKQLNPA